MCVTVCVRVYVCVCVYVVGEDRRDGFPKQIDTEQAKSIICVKPK